MTFPVILNIAEKPSVARQLVSELAVHHVQKLKTFSKWNHVFQFHGSFSLQNCTMIVTSVRGHLMELTFPSDYLRWEEANLLNLLEVPLTKIIKSDCSGLAKNLQYYAKISSLLYLWLDCDREGENICFEVMNVCQRANPKLKVYRPRFSSLSQTELVNAMRNPSLPNSLLSEAVDCRQELDFRTGTLLTRFLTLRYKTKIFTDLLSFGLCQFPTLGLVTKRFIEKQKFISEPFWYLVVDCQVPSTTTHSQNNAEGKLRPRDTITFLWDRGHVFEKKVVEAFYILCNQSPRTRVENVSETVVTKSKPLPLLTNDLTMMASRKLHLSSKQTMNYAESLYQRGFVSYPRTETNQFSSDIPLKSLIQRQYASEEWGFYALSLLEENLYEPPRQGTKNDQAHPPIHPVRIAQAKDFNNIQEWRVYRFITIHFLACCSKNAKALKTHVVISRAEEKFTTHGLTITEPNFLTIYSFFDPWTEKALPKNYFVPGMCLSGTLHMKSGTTSSPELLTEAELIRLMSQHGIGTDATIHEHIDTVQKRSYVAKIRSYLQPTVLGYRLYKGFKAYGDHDTLDLTHHTLRERIEKDIANITIGKTTAMVVLRENITAFKNIVQRILHHPTLLDTMILQPCPLEPASIPGSPLHPIGPNQQENKPPQRTGGYRGIVARPKASLSKAKSYRAQKVYSDLKTRQSNTRKTNRNKTL